MQKQKKRILIAKRLTIAILALTLMIVMLPVSGTLADEQAITALSVEPSEFSVDQAEEEGSNAFSVEEGSEEALLSGGEGEEPSDGSSLEEDDSLASGDGGSENPKFGNVEIVKPGFENTEPGNENTVPGKGGLAPGNGGLALDKGGIANGSDGGGMEMGVLSASNYDPGNVNIKDTIDLSLTTSPNIPNPGYTTIGTTPAFVSPYNRYRLVFPTGDANRALRFTYPDAHNETYRLVQTGIYEPAVGQTPNTPEEPNYGTSIFQNIYVNTNVEVTLIISDIDITGQIILEGDAKLTLVLEGKSFVRTNIVVPTHSYNGTAQLTITSISGDDSTDGRLEIPSKFGKDENRYRASIGGNNVGDNSGTIIIDGGTIDITAYSKGAGIGGAGGIGNNLTGTKAGSATTTVINGGHVKVMQYGIGDGNLGRGASGACIGGGGGEQVNGGSAGDLIINGGTVEATQYTRAAAIGAGMFGPTGNITINDGDVTATMIRDPNGGTGSGEGCAIGASNGTTAEGVGYITINGGNVKATASDIGGAGIGISNGGQPVHITITGGNVVAKANQGPGIGCWVENRDSTITITGGTVYGESVINAGIGGRSEGRQPLFELGPDANVTAFSRGEEPAINTKSNTGTGYYVNASLYESLPAYTALEVYKDTDADTRFKLLELPTGWKNFAYSTKQTTAGTDTIIAMDGGGAIIGIVVRYNDDKPQIVPMKNFSDYNPHNNYYSLPPTNPLHTRFPYENILPVTLSNGSGIQMTVTEKYVDIYGVPIPGKADTTTLVNFNDDLNQYQAHFLALPGIPGYAGKGHKWNTAPDSSGMDFTAGTPPKTTIMTNKTIYLVYGLMVDVMVSKTVTNDFADRTKPFTFKAYFKDENGNAVATTEKFNCTGGIISGSGATAPSLSILNLAQDGIGTYATFTLSHGQTLTIHGITDGSKIRVIETTATGYTASYKDSNDANITPGNDTLDKTLTASVNTRTFAFINANDTVPPTGIIEGAGAGIALAGILLIFVGMEVAKFIRRKKAWTE